MPENGRTTCWVVTDGKMGMENQCLGLAEALGLTPVVKRIRLRTPWKQLAPFLRFGLGHAFSRKGDPIAPPFPDLIIATGRASIPASLYVRQQGIKTGGRRTFIVHLQNPVIDPSRFDLVVVPRHDGMTGPNVITTRGSLHRITPEKLQEGTDAFLPQVQHLPKPRITVILGGNSAVHHLTPREMLPIAQQLRQAALNSGGSLLVTPSRRTGEANVHVLQDALRDTPSYVWDGTGPNPYFGMLGLADFIVVTSDSINLATEACATGKPVYVIDLPGGSDKFRRFHQALRDDGLTRPFTGKLESWSYTPLREMELVAGRVREGMERP